MDSKQLKDQEALIRRLKLLSKSQSAFLKKFVHDKITASVKVVNEGMDIIYRSNNTDARLAAIKRELANLRLEDLEVGDISTFQIALKQEIEILRQSIDGGLPAPLSIPAAAAVDAPVATSPTAADSGRLRALEAENNNLRELLKEAQTALTKAQSAAANKPQATPPPPPPPSNDGALDELRSRVSALTAEVADRDARLQDITARLNDKSAEATKLAGKAQEAELARSLQVEVAKMKTEVAALERELSKTKKEADERLNAKVAELSRSGDQRVAEVEKRLEEVKEEMMDAMAQEVEAIEKQNIMEKEAIMAEKAKVEVALNKSRNSRQAVVGGVATIGSKTHAIVRDYKVMLGDTRRQLEDMKVTMRSQLSEAVLFKLRDTSQQLTTMTTRYRRELSERKRLHNLVQELKGNIRVFLRCRPPSSKEHEQYGSEAVCITFPNPQEVKVFNEKSREKSWEFDEVFGFDSTQEEIYTEVSALVTSVLDGFNVCIFAYGQTGSGKTFTMSGPAENRGVNTRALGDLFTKTSARSSEYRETITVSVLEVYNEDIHDLLSDSSSGEKLEVRQGEFGNHVPGLTNVPVNNLQNVFDLLAVADRNRSQTATNMNEHSSRSHMMLTVTLVTESLINGAVTRGRLNLVDLAGSERINKSGATGQALKEAQNINKSLSALGDVIAARAQKQAHVPFRNSTLTYLLQDSISQDSKTLMIVCVSPVLYSAEETFCSLNFASRVRTVELGRASKTTLTGAAATSATAGTGSSKGPVSASAGAAGSKLSTTVKRK